MTFRVVVTASKLAPAGVELLQEAGCDVRYAGTADLLAQALSAEPVDAIVSRTLPLSRDLILAGKGLRVISRHGAGADNVDIAAATDCGIPVLVAASANAISVVEQTIGLMVAAARNIAGHDAAIRDGIWDRSTNGAQLAGRRLGLIGLGEIGRGVARIAVAMGMRVAAFDPRVDAALVPAEVEMVADIEGLLARSDVLSLHCPLTPETRGMIGAGQLASMPAGAIIVNTARGPLIDEAALAAALTSGHIAGAGLDTFVTEPLPPPSPLRACRTVVLTPHMGGSTREAVARTAAMAVTNALNVLRGETVPPGLCVNPVTLRAKELS